MFLAYGCLPIGNQIDMDSNLVTVVDQLRHAGRGCQLTWPSGFSVFKKNVLIRNPS